MKNSLLTLRRTSAPTASQSSSDTPPSRHLRVWWWRVLPWAVALLVLIVAWGVFGERLLPATRVEVETVVTDRGDPGEIASAAPTGGQDAFAGEVRFQASGWFEADPFSHRATALADGIVETVHFLEGETVSARDPIVSLIREDTALARQQAEAATEAARAATKAAESEHSLALAEIESMAQRIAVSEARREELADLAQRAQGMGPEVISKQEIRQAQLRLATQEREIAALRADLRVREISAERLAGQWEMQEAKLAAAQAQLAQAELAHRRMEVRSPIDGIVQRLMVAPGEKKMLMADHPDSATVALVFDPTRMQARVDVPLADASRLFLGQAVLLESEFFPGQTLRGTVRRIAGEADLQRNTLQAKVRVFDPPTGWRPDILCRARFLDTSVEGGSSEESGNAALAPSAAPAGLRVFVPVNALSELNERKATVWAIDASGRHLERREVELGSERRDGFRHVQSGLRPGDRVVLNPAPELQVGERVQYP